MMVGMMRVGMVMGNRKGVVLLMRAPTCKAVCEYAVVVVFPSLTVTR
jgi:hypothetical protein